MEGKIRSGGQRRIVGVDLADPENPGWCPAIALRFAQARFVLTGEAATPGEPFLAKENRARWADGLPRPGAGTLEALQRAPHCVPVRGEADDQLLTIVRDAGGMGAAGHLEQDQSEDPPKDRTHFQT